MKRFFPLAFPGLSSELRSTLHGLVRRPGYPVAAWVMLGLAITANAAAFAIVYGFLLKPLPFAQPNQLSLVRERAPKIGLNTPLVSVNTYLALKHGIGGIESAGLFTHTYDSVATINGRAHLLQFERVTPSLLYTLGVSPIVGRLPMMAAGKPGGSPETVISYRLWQSAYSGNRNALGQSFKVGDKSYRIVGVMPAGFFVEEGNSDAWLPYVITPGMARISNRNYWMMARRKPGVSLHQLNLELTNYRQRMLSKKPAAVRAQYIQNGYTIDARAPRSVALAIFGIGNLPWLLQAAAGFLLLLALANTINLGLVRQRARQHEFALRRMLGASRSRLVRLILLEHLPIVLITGATATLLAWGSINALHSFGLPPAFSPFNVTLAPSVIAFAWTMTAIVMLIVIFGPAMLAGGRRLLSALGHGATTTGGKGLRRMQRALGAVQITLACALLIAGGLLGVSLWHIMSQPVGFTPRHRVAVRVILPNKLKNYPAAWARLKPRLLRLPDVHSAAVAGMLPFSKHLNMGNVRMPGEALTIHARMPVVSAGFFSTMGIEFAAGRGFTPADIANQAPVLVISDALANKFFMSPQDAIGQSLILDKRYRIIGVTRNVLWAPTPSQYVSESSAAYLPLGAFNEGFTVVVQANEPPETLERTLKLTIRSALPDSQVLGATSLPQMVQSAVVFRAAGAGLVGAFAGLALLLAAIGVFAITSFITRARLGEYGIRAALGAGPWDLLRLGLREAAWLLVIALPIGLACAYLLGRAIAGALYRTPVLDPWLYIAGAVLIAVVVLAAAWRPAYRAARTPVRDLIDRGP